MFSALFAVSDSDGLWVLAITIGISLLWLLWDYGPAVLVWRPWTKSAVTHQPHSYSVPGGPNLADLAITIAAVQRCLPPEATVAVWQDRVLAGLRVKVRNHTIADDIADAMYAQVLAPRLVSQYYEGVVFAFGESFTVAEMQSLRTVALVENRQPALGNGPTVSSAALSRFYTRVAAHEAAMVVALFDAVRSSVLRTPPNHKREPKREHTYA